MVVETDRGIEIRPLCGPLAGERIVIGAYHAIFRRMVKFIRELMNIDVRHAIAIEEAICPHEKPRSRIAPSSPLLLHPLVLVCRSWEEPAGGAIAEQDMFIEFH